MFQVLIGTSVAGNNGWLTTDVVSGVPQRSPAWGAYSGSWPAQKRSSFEAQSLHLPSSNEYRLEPSWFGGGARKRAAQRGRSPNCYSPQQTTRQSPRCAVSDETYMDRCIQLALMARPSPNPPVGCVVVDPDTGRIVGEGFHPRAGYPHAEQYALQATFTTLRNASSHQNQHLAATVSEPVAAPPGSARGMHVYVTLEPCNHYGRTPPCTESLIQAQVSRVVIGTRDPDPRTAGSGAERLRRAGIEVQFGPRAAECVKLYEGFQHRIHHQTPLGILKYAMSLDGKIATETGDARWVSSATSRRYVHELRARCDAVVVGAGTVRRDDPALTVRLEESIDVPELGYGQPLRVVMCTSAARLWRDRPDAKLWDTSVAPTVLAVSSAGEVSSSKELDAAEREAILALRSRGVQIAYLDALLPLPPTRALMQWLYDYGCTTVLWECGGTLATSAVRESAVHKILVFVAPKLVGGRSSPTPIAADLGVRNMEEALALRLGRMEVIGSGQDVLIEAYLDSNKLSPDAASGTT